MRTNTLLVATAYGELMENYGKLTLGTSPFIAGVCDGLANQLTVGVVYVRLVFILFSFFLGGGFLAYLLLTSCFTCLCLDMKVLLIFLGKR